MSKPVKDLVTNYLRNRYDGVANACVVSLAGIDVQSVEKIRDTLHEQNASMEVVKNSLARRAFADTPLAPLGKALSGPCAIVCTDEDGVVEIAKLLVKFSKEYKKLELKQAIYDGDPDLLSVTDLSKMKSRAETLGEVAGCIAGPGRRLAGCIGSPAGKIAGCLKAIAEKE